MIRPEWAPASQLANLLYNKIDWGDVQVIELVTVFEEAEDPWISYQAYQQRVSKRHAADSLIC